MAQIKYDYELHVYFRPNPPFWRSPMVDKILNLSKAEARDIMEIFKNNRNVEKVEIVG